MFNLCNKKHFSVFVRIFKQTSTALVSQATSSGQLQNSPMGSK